MGTEGAALLRDAYTGEKAPRKPGVWKVFEDGRLMTLGKAKDGLRKRFSDLYRGKKGGTAGKEEIDERNRDRIVVWWRQCSCQDCVTIFDSMHQECTEAGEELPWLHRDPPSPS